MLQQRRWALAYAQWRQLAPGPQQATARALLRSIARLDLSLVSDGPATAPLQRDVISTLSVLGGVPQVWRGVARLVGSRGEQRGLRTSACRMGICFSAATCALCPPRPSLATGQRCDRVDAAS